MASLIQKAYAAVQKASRGTLSAYVLNAPHEWGQPPITMAGDVQQLISPERMREIVMRTPTASALMNATLDYCLGVELGVRNLDATKPADASHAQAVMEFLRYPNGPNGTDTGRRFKAKIFRDLFTLGWGAAEIEPGKRSGKPANLWALDGARVRVDYDEHGSLLGYDMLDAHGMPIRGNDGVHAWKPGQVLYFSKDPVSSSLYPTSRITQLFTLAVLEDLMIAFISGRFTESNVPYGVMGVGDVTEKELKTAIGYWNSQAHDKHRILLTGTKGGGKLDWVPFNDRLKDLDATNLLSEIRSKMMAITGVTANELGESGDINKSNGYNLSYTFKKRAIEPLLDEFCETFTSQFIRRALGFSDIELYYKEIDSRDELLQSQIDDLNVKNGTWSINHIRNQRGQPSTNGGDIPVIFTGSAYIPVSMINDFAQAQLDALLVVNEETQTMIDQAKQQMEQQAQQTSAPAQAVKLQAGISEPLTRPMQMPERYTTPDASGSSTAKVKLLKPALKISPPVQAKPAPPGQAGNPRKTRLTGARAKQTRGIKHATKQVGNRS